MRENGCSSWETASSKGCHDDDKAEAIAGSTERHMDVVGGTCRLTEGEEGMMQCSKR
jgi:hypothetical protein